MDALSDHSYYEKLKVKLDGEDPVVRRRIKNEFFPMLMDKSYAEVFKEKNKYFGDYSKPTIGSSIKLNEDFFAFTYLYQLRRSYLFEQSYYGNDNSDEDSDVE